MGKILKTGMLLTILTFLGKVTAFFRETLIAAVYGASSTTDAYLVAFSLINIIFMTFGAAIGTTIIPGYTKIKNAGTEQNIEKYLSSFISFLLIVSIVIILVSWLSSSFIISSLFPNLKDKELAVALTNILLPTLILMIINSFITNILNVHKVFLFPSLGVFLGNLIVVLVLVVSKSMSIYPLVIGQICSLVFQVLLLIVVSKKLNLTFTIKLTSIDFQLIRDDLKSMLPIILVTIMMQSNVIVDRFLSSSLGTGSVTKISLAYKITDFLVSILITVFGTILYSNFAEFYLKKEYRALSQMFIKSVKIILIITIPIVAGAILYSRDIVTVLLGYGKFNGNDVDYTAKIFMFYACAIPVLVINSIIVRFMYAVGQSRTVNYNQMIYTVLNIILGISLVKIFKGVGLPLAFATSTLISLLLLMKTLKKYINQSKVNELLFFNLKIIASALIMSISLISYNSLVKNVYIKLFSGVILGIIVYFITLILLRVEEFAFVSNLVRKRGHNGFSSK